MTPEEGGRKKPCTADMQLMVFSKTWDCAAFVSLVGKDMAMPGEDASMNLRLMKPMVLEEGQQFTIRDSTGTIGTGNFGFTVNAKQIQNILHIERTLIFLGGYDLLALNIY